MQFKLYEENENIGIISAAPYKNVAGICLRRGVKKEYAIVRLAQVMPMLSSKKKFY